MKNSQMKTSHDFLTAVVERSGAEIKDLPVRALCVTTHVLAEYDNVRLGAFYSGHETPEGQMEVENYHLIVDGPRPMWLEDAVRVPWGPKPITIVYGHENRRWAARRYDRGVLEYPEMMRHPADVITTVLYLVGLKPTSETKDGPWYAREYTRQTDAPVILVTHSELVLLAIRQQMLRGVLRPEDILIVVADEEKHGEEIRLLPDGSFDRPWPGGFFPEQRKLTQP